MKIALYGKHTTIKKKICQTMQITAVKAKPSKTLLRAMEQLKRGDDNVITKADKGSGVVVVRITTTIIRTIRQ